MARHNNSDMSDEIRVTPDAVASRPSSDQQIGERQQIVHAEPRAPSADTHERIRRSHVGPTDRDRMKGAVGPLQGDSILPPKLL